MKTDNPIKSGIDSALKSSSFSRKTNMWYLDSPETVLVLDLQKSNFGDQYYVNLGIFAKWVPSLVKKQPPRENECHIRARIDAVCPEGERSRFEKLFNLDDVSIGDDARREHVESVVSKFVVPFLLQCRTRDGVVRAYRDGSLSKFLIQKSVRDSLEG